MFYPVHFIEHILRGLNVCHKLQTSNHPLAFLHKINSNLKHRFTNSQIAQQFKNAPKPRLQHDHTRIYNQIIQCPKFQQEQTTPDKAKLQVPRQRSPLVTFHSDQGREAPQSPPFKIEIKKLSITPGSEVEKPLSYLPFKSRQRSPLVTFHSD